MTNERFKELETNYGNDPMIFCFNYFQEEKNSNIDFNTFQSMFHMWIMLQSMGNFNGGINHLMQWLKNKHR